MYTNRKNQNAQAIFLMPCLEAPEFQTPKAMSMQHRITAPTMFTLLYFVTKILQPDFRIKLAKGKFSPGHV